MVDDVVSFVRRGRVGIVSVSRPPVNAIDVNVRRGMRDAFLAAQEDTSVDILVLACKGRTFMSGADLAEFDTGVAKPDFRETLSVLEQSKKPIVASMHGTVLGGGLETALACHYRVAVASTKLGFPEITLGVIPGAGATQRLPRLVGAMPALKMLIAGAPVDAAAAIALGLVDKIVEGDPEDAGIAYAEELLRSNAGVRRTADRPVDTTGFDENGITAVLEANAKALKGRSTQHAFVEAVTGSAKLPLEQGLDLEKRLSDASLETRESKGLRHIFFAERGTTRIPGADPKIKPLEIRKVAIIGAGTMGSGIAIAFGNAGFDVTLIDSSTAGLDRGRGIVRANYDAQSKRGRMTPAQAEAAIANIKTSLDLDAVVGADLVIEAVFEDIDLKKKIFSQIDAKLGPHAIVATNTSSLSVTEIAAVTSRPESVVGLHFFSPAHIMRLLEIIRGGQTSVQTLVTAVEIGRKVKKIPVVAGDRFGFIGNKMMLDGSFREGEQLMLEGAGVDQIDKAMEDIGFAMGQSKVNDMAGIDVGTFVREQLYKKESRPDPYCVVSDALTPLGRIGQKVGKGFYDYSADARVGKVDPEVSAVIANLAASRNIHPRVVSDSEIVERCLLQLINVGADLLENGVAYRAADIDIVWVYGYGFPRHLGGPMFHADTLGLPHVLDRIRHWNAKFPGYWTPSKLIERLAHEDSSFVEFDRQVSKG
jgi:3-hydroxyacyl-CoA dehydrogenase